MKRKAFVVMLLDKDDVIRIDGVIGSRSNAEARKNELDDYKWVKKSWIYYLDMNETFLNLAIREPLK